jgi:hypothetical protein
MWVVCISFKPQRLKRDSQATRADTAKDMNGTGCITIRRQATNNDKARQRILRAKSDSQKKEGEGHDKSMWVVKLKKAFIRNHPGLSISVCTEKRQGGKTYGVDLAEHELLELVVHGQDTGTGNTTEDVGTGTLEERLDALGSNDLGTSIEHGLVVDGTTRSHHHTTTDSVERVRSKTGTGGDTPTKSERSEEVALKRTDEDDGLKGVVETEVETTVDNDTDDGGDETTVETGNTVGGEGLAVDVYEAVELTRTTGLGRLVVVGKTGTGVVERVDEEERRGTGGTTRGNVTEEVRDVTVRLLAAEHGLEPVLESKVQGLGGEVTDDVGGVTTPEGGQTLVGVGATEAVGDALVRVRETALLDPARVSFS